MHIYEGAVLFVDILGISALTKAKKDIVIAKDFAAFGRSGSASTRNQVFCAVLLTQFRKNLRALKTPKLRVAQLSDCAFIWSRDINEVVEFARALFWRNLKSGLLCRGGMTYGEIVEPEKIGKRIGDFVCGEAVTRSVELERAGKGSRIFIDRDIGGKIFSNTPPHVFKPAFSPIDFKTVDEYLWFALPSKGNVIYKTPPKHVMNIIDVALSLRFAPHFRWNTISEEGRLQVGATIERMRMFVKQFCGELQLPEPHFAFLPFDSYVDREQVKNGSERNDRTYTSMKMQAIKYQENHFPKIRNK